MNPAPMLTHSTFVRRTQRIFSLLLCIVVVVPCSFAQRRSATDDELKLVVALFRHGVRSPEPGFNQDKANQHSSFRWPDLAAWNVMRNDCDCGDGWGYLTLHGRDIARGLGKYYGTYYKRGSWSNGFNVYLWADAENQRTRHTAKALVEGFQEAGVPSSQANSLTPCTTDLLFHPFIEGCGTPDPTKLSIIKTTIENGWPIWINTTYKTQFQELFRSLGCVAKHCYFPVNSELVNSWSSGNRESPVTWTGKFSYASSATEAFLLEYANRMKVGWGTVNTADMDSMLSLHEFYFTQTQRDSYLAKIQGSNLVNEISNVINSKVNGQRIGCPHAPLDSQFVGLVGHDTNLANVGALLDLQWKFDDPRLPNDTKGLPDNDALPAGALVFELRQRNGAWVVRVEYVTQSLLQMRNGPVSEAFRLRVLSSSCTLPGNNCEMPLATFNSLVSAVDKKFLSTCDGNTQICSPGPGGSSNCKKPKRL